MNIIFVCTGNTCRSPMAEGYLSNKKIPWLSVISRGIAADGSSVCQNACEAMADVGIDISGHISKPLTKEDIKWADRIICLSSNHFNILLSSGVAPKKLSVLGEGISDPYGAPLEVYKSCRDEIIRAIDMLFETPFFSNFKIVEIQQRHISGIAKLEKICFSEPWSAETILDAYNRGVKFFVAENETDIIGYIGFSAVAGEGYVTNVAVFPKYRRMGVGTALINEAVSYCKSNSFEFLSLEVRKSNMGAIKLYEKSGFTAQAERKDFYRNPKENAIIMTNFFK